MTLTLISATDASAMLNSTGIAENFVQSPPKESEPNIGDYLKQTRIAEAIEEVKENW